MYVGNRDIEHKIIPAMLFTGEQCGKAEEALKFYNSIFQNSSLGNIVNYGPGQDPNTESMVMHGEFTMENLPFWAMDSALNHSFTFNEAVSFVVKCKDQGEVDCYWKALSAYPEAEQCGWLKDKFGFSWQIVPEIMDRMLRDPDKARLNRVTQTFLKMKKLDIAELEKAAR